MPTKSFNLRLNEKISSFSKTIKVDSDKSISSEVFDWSISQNISSVKNVLESEYKISNYLFKKIRCTY